MTREALLALAERLDALSPFDQRPGEVVRELNAIALSLRALAGPPRPARTQCSCAIPDPVMQADRRFYCHTCSFQVPAVPCERCQSIATPPAGETPQETRELIGALKSLLADGGPESDPLSRNQARERARKALRAAGIYLSAEPT